ncbi:testicular haploid expressed gene isoform X2 [Megachile rotundata]|uniref:testicular haploid expressed gene isoform X2 n=1 Tax=Megachile rotundata TaxID=143995 RepID=UPI003FD4A05B
MASTLAQRIKYAMQHLSHEQHISLLARPNWRRIQWKNVHALANPFTTRRAALKAKASKRIKVMARPKYVAKKHDFTKIPPLYQKIHPKTLEAKITKRIIDLALPKKRTLMSNMVFASMSSNIAETLWKVQNSRYRRYRFFCNARKQREMKRKQRIMAKLRRAIKPEDWDRHIDILSKLATPKVPPKPRMPFKRKRWRPVNMRRIEELSTPSMREIPLPKDPFTVPQTALIYRISKRMVELSQPREVPDIAEMFRIPGYVSPAALEAHPRGR